MKITTEELEELCFSTNEETYSKFDDIVDEISDEESDISISVGQSIKQKHSDFIYPNYIIEQMSENAYEVVGEVAESYLDGITKEQKLGLENIIQDYFNEITGEPNFYSVINTKEITKKQFLELDFEFKFKDK